MSPESRLVGEGETTVTESAPREVPGESDSVEESTCKWVVIGELHTELH